MNNNAVRILLADDDEDDRMLFKLALTEVNPMAELLFAVNGEVLMDRLFAAAAALPHFIFLDLNMPRKSGMECLKEIRANQLFNHIPVVIYSTSSNIFDKDEAKKLGANLYLEKSLYPQLRATLSSIFTGSISMRQIPSA